MHHGIMKPESLLYLRASVAHYKDASRKIEVIANENSCHGDMLIRSAITYSEKAAKCLQDFLEIKNEKRHGMVRR